MKGIANPKAKRTTGKAGKKSRKQKTAKDRRNQTMKKEAGLPL